MVRNFEKKEFYIIQIKQRSLFNLLKNLPLTDDVILLIIEKILKKDTHEQKILKHIYDYNNLYDYYNPPKIKEYQELDLY